MENSLLKSLRKKQAALNARLRTLRWKVLSDEEQAAMLEERRKEIMEEDDG